MNPYSIAKWGKLIIAASMVAIAVSGCGSDGAQGPAGPPGPPGPTGGTPTALNMTITGVTVSSPPVVNFSVTNQDGNAYVGLTTSDLRFTVAKLTPGSNGNASTWQNYVVTVQNSSSSGPQVLPSAVQGTRENNGTLVDNGDGTYRYTFATDIANVACPAPCQDANGNPLDLSYNASLTHRVGIQTRGSLPAVNATYTFRPSDGATTGIFSREIVKTAKCNECHDKLEAHDARIEAKYCVTCHNPGSTDPDSGNTVDFKVMIHKIHRGASLPTVVDGGDYVIYGYGGTAHNFNDIHFPQDIRNCTKCHDGADPDTPQGANWDTAPSIEACGSCHDKTRFDEAPGTSPDSHPGGIVDNSVCLTCHAAGRVAGSVAEAHTILEKVAAAKLKFNILEVCGSAPGSNPQCGSPATPVVKFSVTDPTGATTHGYGNAYNIKTDPEFTASAASLNLLIAWDTRDFNNNQGSGTRPGRANSINLKTLALGPTFVDNADGTYTVTSPVLPVAAIGTGAVAMEGHPAGLDNATPPAYTVRATVKAVVAYFGISDNPLKPRRQVVEITSKCDRCHDLLSVHGNNRSDEAQLCVMCHNPNNTDVAVRPMTAGLPDPSLTLDGKKEESIDFKRLIHGVHAAAKSNFDGTIAHGFREKGLVIYGYGGSEHDYSHLRFPGVLSRCTTCHLPGTYQLTGTWELPTQNGILGSTIDSAPGATAATFVAQLADQADDLNISPTAAVCSACHDSALAQQHMVLNGAQFGVTQAAIGSLGETCAICHGPGRIASVDFVHSGEFGEEIP